MTQHARPEPSGWPCRWPATWSASWPSPTAGASARSSSAAPTFRPARSTRCSSLAGTPSRRVCPSCAERAKTLRAAQCREGWHLDHEPVTEPDEPDDAQRMWVEMRAEAQQSATRPKPPGEDTAELDALNAELDEEIARVRGPRQGHARPPARRHRSTRRRQDAPDLPRRKIARPRSARPTPRRTARRTGRRCSSP